MESRNKFKLFLPGLVSQNNNDICIIAADIREEQTTLGYYTAKNQKVFLNSESIFQTKEFFSFTEMLEFFISENNLSAQCKVAIAVPGPVIRGKSEPARLPWKLDNIEIQEALGLTEVLLINDLEASAYGLECVADDQIVKIHDSVVFTPGNVALLAPGAGLGEAALFYDGDSLRPFATEGGHCEFSPRTAEEVEFYSFLQKIYGIVSWESVLSKAGLFNIYRFLRDVKRHKQPDWLGAEIDADNFCEAVIRGAKEKKDRICILTIETFLTYLAREANSLVLKMKATGGLFLTGHIPFLLESFITNDKFYQNFIISDKMENILQDIPIYLVKDQKTILNGAATFAAYYRA